ncbi:hypothetical protein LIER_08039 [Lithospermum erythrorhizon]|uniref:Transmembrane protein n=1 Tax=Lithospermum erythrorhizon TaxID=34254 RepID=A0AAV3PD75_LITER
MKMIIGNFSAGFSNHDWNPVMTADTANLSYWLNWRFLVCAIFVLIAMVVAAVLIWKHEGFGKSRKGKHEDHEEEIVGTVNIDDCWKTSSESIHAGWLLGYRLIALCILVALLLSEAIVNGARIFYFYTEWTFTLITIYFGLASAFSVYGCLHHWKAVGDGRADFDKRDAERGNYMPPLEGVGVPDMLGTLNSRDEPHNPKAAGFGGYTLQILYQVCAGAVALTDIVYWLIIYPFLTNADYKLRFLVICMHTVNAVFFLGELVLNRLQFPLFRIAYFALWTSVFVIFQWIIHMCVSLWWPYPFLDLSSQYAPIWYLAVGLLHLPCYCMFPLILRAKQFCLSRFNP